MMRKQVLLCTILFAGAASAQKTGRALADSLIAAIPGSANDTVKARLYNRLFNELTNISISEAMSFAKTGLEHTKEMKWPKGIAVFQQNIGQAYSSKGNYDSAIFYFTTALATHSKAGDKYNMAATNNNLGSAAQNIRSDYTAAMQYYFRALQIAEEIKDSTLLSVCLHNIGGLYMIQQNFSKALEFEKKALTIREKKGSGDEIAASYETIGNIYYNLHDLQKAKVYYNRALTLFESTGNLPGLASIWSSLSLTYENDYRGTIEARIKAKEIWNQVDPFHITSITNTGNLGVAYLDIVRYDTARRVKYGNIIPDNRKILLQKAEDNLKTAIRLFEEAGEVETRSYFQGVLAELHELNGDYKNAYYNYKAYQEVQDSVFSQENKNKIAATESQLLIDKKNSELKINQLALSNQRRTLWGLAGGLILLAVIGILLYRQGQLRKKTNASLLLLNKELDNANQVKVKFFSIISHDLRGPVARLINFLHLQKEAPDLLNKEQSVQHQQKITEAATALLDNMETVLLWSKGQMELFRPKIKEVPVTDLFAHIGKFFLGAENVQFNYHAPAGFTINTDENYLKTIMHNLTANAVKAVRQTENPVISWTASQEEGNRILCITDNGPGFPVELMRQFNDNNLSIQGNNGLGIHIVKDMAKAIGCQVTFRNNTNGAEVILRLPA